MSIVYGSAGKPNGRKVVVSGGVILDVASRQALVEGAKRALRPFEARLLAYLMEHAGEDVTVARILSDVWGTDWAGTRAARGPVYVTMCTLRRKIAPARIETVSGQWDEWADRRQRAYRFVGVIG